MKPIKNVSSKVWEPSLTQRQYAELTGFDQVTINNLIQRNILAVDEVVPGRGRGDRRFSPWRAWKDKIFYEVVTHHKMPLKDAADIAGAAARLAAEGKYIEYWAGNLSRGRSSVAAFMLVTWDKDCYDARIVTGDKDGGPDFSSPDTARFLAHPFLMIPLSAFFEEVWKKGMAMLASEK